MTLQTRRRTYWILFGIDAFLLLVGLVFSLILAFMKRVPIFLIERGIYATYDLFGLRIPSLGYSLVNALLLAVYSVGVSFFILKTFRKTVSPEIFFFVFWLCSLSFEAIRPLHLFMAVQGASDSSLSILDRLYMGSKFLGLITIFISGLYAAGMRNEKQFSIIAICVGISAALSSIMPVNTGIWAANLMFRLGYGRLVDGFSAAILLITMANYLIAVRVRGDKAYYYIAAGAAMTVAGALIASRGASPLASLISLAVMAAGGFVYIYKLHSFYLWQ
ncbi:MAG: hypothetical protein PHT55_02690 [Spirochaetales bacterium]|nr:hypothetical protein [Spirochaetales bacterium]